MTAMLELSCEHQVEPDERVWLREDDTTVCDDCHADELREDVLDRFDHGSPHKAGELLDRGLGVLYVPDYIPNKEDLTP